MSFYVNGREGTVENEKLDDSKIVVRLRDSRDIVSNVSFETLLLWTHLTDTWDVNEVLTETTNIIFEFFQDNDLIECEFLRNILANLQRAIVSQLRLDDCISAVSVQTTTACAASQSHPQLQPLCPPASDSRDFRRAACRRGSRPPVTRAASSYRWLQSS